MEQIDDIARQIDERLLAMMTGRDLSATCATAKATPERTATPQLIYDAQAALLKSLTGKNWKVTPHALEGVAYRIKPEFAGDGEVFVCHPKFASKALAEIARR